MRLTIRADKNRVCFRGSKRACVKVWQEPLPAPLYLRACEYHSAKPEEHQATVLSLGICGFESEGQEDEFWKPVRTIQWADTPPGDLSADNESQPNI